MALLMRVAVLAGTVVAGVAVLIVVIILLYITISYRYWKRLPDEERRKYCLNNVYRKYLQYSEKKKASKQNERNLKVSTCMATEYTQNNPETGNDNKVSTTVNYNKSDGNTSPESVTLDIHGSPIRKSAETYSIVDLSDG